MKKLFIGDIVSRAWDLAVKHWPVFLIIALIIVILIILASCIKVVPQATAFVIE